MKKKYKQLKKYYQTDLSMEDIVTKTNYFNSTLPVKTSKLVKRQSLLIGLCFVLCITCIFSSVLLLVKSNQWKCVSSQNEEENRITNSIGETNQNNQVEKNYFSSQCDRLMNEPVYTIVFSDQIRLLIYRGLIVTNDGKINKKYFYCFTSKNTKNLQAKLDFEDDSININSNNLYGYLTEFDEKTYPELLDIKIEVNSLQKCYHLEY